MRTVRLDSAPEDIARLLRGLEPQLRQVFVRFHVPEQDCEDLLQDCLLAFVGKRGRIASPSRWLVSALANRCLNYWRSRRRALLEAVDTAVLEQMAAPVEANDRQVRLSHDLTCAIFDLPRHCRAILRLRYGLDHDGADVAEKLGYAPGSIRQVTNRCLSALTRRLVNTGFEAPEHSREATCGPVT